MSIPKRTPKALKVALTKPSTALRAQCKSGRRGYRIAAGGLAPALVAGMLIGSGGTAAQAAPAARTARMASAVATVPAHGGPSATIRSIERRVLRLAARMAAARGERRPARIGWFIPVDCYCLMADEHTFQDALEPVFKIAAIFDHMAVKVQPNTIMKVNRSLPDRIPDIYYFRLNHSHPKRGLGYINEPKVGSQGMSSRSRTRESKGDHQLIKQGHGTGANAATRGRYLPVTAGLWWFAPNASGRTYSDFHFIAHLLSLSINVIYMIQNPNAKPWPRRETKKQKAKDVKEIESNSQSEARKGLNNMMAPCQVMCPVG